MRLEGSAFALLDADNQRSFVLLFEVYRRFAVIMAVPEAQLPAGLAVGQSATEASDVLDAWDEWAGRWDMPNAVTIIGLNDAQGVIPGWPAIARALRAMGLPEQQTTDLVTAWQAGYELCSRAPVIGSRVHSGPAQTWLFQRLQRANPPSAPGMSDGEKLIFGALLLWIGSKLLGGRR